jgi:hypothetical protein
VDNRTYNALLRGLRSLGERGFAVLTGRWRVLHHTTASPSKIGNIVKAALVLTQFEYGRLNSKLVRSPHCGSMFVRLRAMVECLTLPPGPLGATVLNGCGWCHRSRSTRSVSTPPPTP